MSKLLRAPRWLQIAAAVMVGERVLVLISVEHLLLNAVGLLVAVVVAWFLLRGSRVAWVFALIMSVSQLTAPLAFDSSWWIAGAAAIVLAGLLIPSSRDFVWRQKHPGPKGRLPLDELGRQSKLADMPYELAGRVAGLTAGWSKEMKAADKPRPYGKQILILAIGVFILIPLVGVLYRFHHGSGSGSIAVDVLWRVVWIVYTLVRLALIVLVVIAGYNYLTGRMQRRRDAASDV